MVSGYSVGFGNACLTHHTILTVSPLTDVEYVLVYIGNYGVIVHNQLSLKKGVSDDKTGAQKTHIEDNKDPVELKLPTSNHLFVILGMPKSRDSIAPALFDDFVLYVRNGPTIATQ